MRTSLATWVALPLPGSPRLGGDPSFCRGLPRRSCPPVPAAFPPRSSRPCYFFSAVVPLLAGWLLHQRQVPPLSSSVRLSRRPRRRRGLPLLRGWPSFPLARLGLPWPVSALARLQSSPAGSPQHPGPSGPILSLRTSYPPPAWAALSLLPWWQWRPRWDGYCHGPVGTRRLVRARGRPQVVSPPASVALGGSRRILSSPGWPRFPSHLKARTCDHTARWGQQLLQGHHVRGCVGCPRFYLGVPAHDLACPDTSQDPGVHQDH